MWCLAKVVDNARGNSTFLGVGNVVQVPGTSVGQRVEDIEVLYGGFAPLLVAEYQINPLMQLLAHVRAFERLPMLCYEDLGVTFRPWWQLNVVDQAAVALPPSGVQVLPSPAQRIASCNALSIILDFAPRMQPLARIVF